MSEIEGLREEVRALRRNQNVWMGLAGFLAVLWCINVIAARWMGDNGIIVARSVLIVDEQGVTRASLGAWPTGDAGLTIHDPDGNGRIWLKAGAEHGTIEITDGERHVQARLSAIENLSGLHLANGARSAQMTASIETTSVQLADLDASLSARLRADPAGTDLELSRNPPDGSPRLATLTAGPDDPAKGAALVLAGPQQFLQASVSAEDGEPRITLAGETRVESRTTATGEPWQRFDRPRPPE